MNNSLYNNSGYIPSHAMINDLNNYPYSYVQDYLTKNIGKQVKVHVSFCDSIDWRDSIFEGTLDEVGKDYIVIKNNQKYVIWSIYIDYIVIA